MKTVILLRHADVDVSAGPAPDDWPLNVAGKVRSLELVHVLGAAGVTAIFASSAARTQQTAAPLVAQTGLSLRVPDTQTKLVTEARSTETGQVVVIVGHRNTVPEIIEDLGASFPGLDIIGHDDLFVVSLSNAGPTSMVRLKYGHVSP